MKKCPCGENAVISAITKLEAVAGKRILIRVTNAVELEAVFTSKQQHVAFVGSRTILKRCYAAGLAQELVTHYGAWGPSAGIELRVCILFG